MNSFLNNILKKYAAFTSKYPLLLLLLVLLLTGFLYVQSTNVQTVSESNQDALPEDIPEIEAFEVLNNKFGGTSGASLVVYLGSDSSSATIDDIRDPDAIAYIDLLTKLSAEVDDVFSVSSPSATLRDLNDGMLPKSSIRINSLTIEHPYAFTNTINDDYSMAIISLSLLEGFDEEELLDDLESLMSQVPIPAGLEVAAAGSSLEGVVVSRELGDDMARTSMFSMIGIVVVLLLIFRSLKYGLTPLFTIGIGVLWTMGYIGLMGMNLSSTTSGVISMIMGIGIDFSIQIVSRFRQELRENSVDASLRITLQSVFVPMTTTTLAAVIGFQAMGLGELTFLAEMGDMMMYGVVGCYLAALLVVPALLILFERFSKRSSLASA